MKGIAGARFDPSVSFQRNISDVPEKQTTTKKKFISTTWLRCLRCCLIALCNISSERLNRKAGFGVLSQMGALKKQNNNQRNCHFFLSYFYILFLEERAQHFWCIREERKARKEFKRTYAHPKMWNLPQDTLFVFPFLMSGMDGMLWCPFLGQNRNNTSLL